MIALHRVMLQEGIGKLSRIMMREQLDPSPFFDQLHSDVVEPFVTVLADILERRARSEKGTAPRGYFVTRSMMLTRQLIVFSSARGSVERMLLQTDMDRIEDILRLAGRM